jgi:hypothetical protein
MPSGYDFQQHIVSVRMRISGSGEFLSTLLALEGDPEQVLTDVTLQSTPNRPVSLLANMTAMRVQFYGRMEAIDENFTLKNLTFYTKPVASGYPQ